MRETYPNEWDGPFDHMVRTFKVTENGVFGRKLDEVETGQWNILEKDTIDAYSAVGFFTAKHIRMKEDVAVGLVDLTLGGAPIEAFMSEESLNGFEHILPTEKEGSQRVADGRLLLKGVLVPDLFKPWFMGMVKIRVGFESSRANLSVRMFEILLDAVQIQGFSVEFDFAGCHDLLVFHGKLAFPLDQGNVRFTKAAALQIDLREDLFPEPGFDLRAEWTVRDGGEQSYFIKRKFRKLLIQIFLFLLIILVRSVDGVADVDEGQLGPHVSAGFVQFGDHIKQVLRGAI